MSLKLLVKTAINLVNSEKMGGLSDPYVTISFQGRTQTSYLPFSLFFFK